MTVRGLLARHADLPQSSYTSPIDVVWRHAANVFVDAAVHRRRRSQRHLLLENDFDQRGESWTATPDRWIAEALMNAREILVARGEMTRALGDKRARE